MTMGFYFLLEWKIKSGTFEESTLDNLKHVKGFETDGSPAEGLSSDVRKKMIIGTIQKETSL